MCEYRGAGQEDDTCPLDSKLSHGIADTSWSGQYCTFDIKLF